MNLTELSSFAFCLGLYLFNHRFFSLYSIINGMTDVVHSIS